MLVSSFGASVHQLVEAGVAVRLAVKLVIQLSDHDLSGGEHRGLGEVASPTALLVGELDVYVDNRVVALQRHRALGADDLQRAFVLDAFVLAGKANGIA